MKAKDKKNVSCCDSGSETTFTEQFLDTDMRKAVRKEYGEFAKRATSGCNCSSAKSVTAQAGYSEDELKQLPDTAQSLSAGCGNPTAIANLKEGEVVLDLGSGGGIDVLLAARKVGSTGKAIGVDMTPEMIDRARENARKSNLGNAEFRLGEIEHLPVADESVDVIVSNCVINLSPEKEKVFGEAYRVLKRGGRMLVSDMMVSGLPDELRQNVKTWSSCVGGAIALDEYVKKIREAGFDKVEVINHEVYPKEVVEDSIQIVKSSGSKQDEKRIDDLVKKVKDNTSISHAEICATKD